MCIYQYILDCVECIVYWGRAVGPAHFICPLTDRPASCRCHPPQPSRLYLKTLQHHCNSCSEQYTQRGRSAAEVNPTYVCRIFPVLCTCSQLLLLLWALLNKEETWEWGAGQTLWLRETCVSGNLDLLILSWRFLGDETFSYHYQGSIDFNTVRPCLSHCSAL